ncbi:hypothetical protein AALP_AA3G346600 [Arabis alpina]|uniref:ABC transporter domain-containing protein n=1 Tax=Arabis alpina TaxID=50452 RepID=A0A087HDM1_ARAAL|nr:hypothetical protein AALP_AA3G346600 [Arabis alpina]
MASKVPSPGRRFKGLSGFQEGLVKQLVLAYSAVESLSHPKLLKSKIGFVTQDDVLFPHLTVKETLTYTAHLCLPKTLTRQQKEQRAFDVMQELGLERCQYTMIGGAFVRGVSGGERKRVSIGNEIMINPSLLFIDEPTSSLDSTTALRTIQMLLDITKAGKTVITTIHQPPSRLFHRFDKLILLGKGNLLYFGESSEVLDYFSSIGRSSTLLWWRSDIRTIRGLQDQAGLIFFLGIFPVFTAILTSDAE